MPGLDEKILALYARGNSTRDISAQLEELYGVNVSSSLISEVTDAVSEEVKAWPCRPLDEVYPILYLDALYVKRAVYVVLGVTVEGNKTLLGLWIGEAEAVACFPKGGGQVLAQGAHRPQKPGHEGYPSRLRGWSHGLSPSH